MPRAATVKPRMTVITVIKYSPEYATPKSVIASVVDAALGIVSVTKLMIYFH